MEYGFKIRAEFAHVKLITKALDILKSISKGEFSRCSSLIEENKKSYTEAKLEYPEFIDLRINSLKSNLLNIEKQYFNNKHLNVLQLGEFGYQLIDIKQRFIDTGIIMRKKKLIKIEIQVNQEDLDIINLACDLYWKIFCGHLDHLANIDLHKIDKDLLKESLFEICDLATGFENNNARLNIENKAVNRKAKWAYDICKSIDNINNDDIKMLHERCESIVALLKTEQLDDQDKIMLDVVVKTGNYLAITLDLMAQDVRLRALESEVESRKRKHVAGVSSPASTDMHIMMQSLCMMGSENTR
jgi:hypothetical protein